MLKEEILKKIMEVKEVMLNDYSAYDPDKCHDGGSYGFSTNYTKQDDGSWLKWKSTTADGFEFCPVCGMFNNHRYYDDDTDEIEYSCGDFEIVSTDQLLDIILTFEENYAKVDPDSYFISYY